MAISSVDELNALTSIVESLFVVHGRCNDASFTVLNLTRFVNLKEFEADGYNFRHVNEVHLIGLSKLERVVIGNYCFMADNNPNSVLRINGTTSLKELIIDQYSFRYYAFEIENAPSLEVIEIGEDGVDNLNFGRTSELVLKSETDFMK